WGTTAAQKTVVAPLGELPAAVARAHLEPPALVVIGDVVRYRERLAWFERRPLFGASVLVPRARAAAAPFVRALAELGAETVVAEVPRIEPIADAAIDLDGTRWVAFASAHAVATTLASLGRRGLDARAFAGIRLAAVGDATAAALAAHGLRADLVPESAPSGAALAHALVAADPILRGARVLLPRPAEGREELGDILAAAAAEVVAVALARAVRVRPAELAPSVRRLDVVPCSAPSQVEALVAAAGAEALNRARLVAAAGATTAAALAAHGVRVDLVASSPNPERFAAEIVAKLHPEAR